MPTREKHVIKFQHDKRFSPKKKKKIQREERFSPKKSMSSREKTITREIKFKHDKCFSPKKSMS